MGRRKKNKPAPTGHHHPYEGGTHTTQVASITPNQQTEEHHNTAEDKKAHGKDYWYSRFVRRPIRQFYIRCLLCWRKADPNGIIAFGTILLGLIGVGGLILTYESLQDSRQIFRETQKPSVSLGRRDGVLAEFVVPQDATLPDQNVGIKIYVQNGGQSAALTVNLGLLPLNLVLNGIGMGQSAPPKVPLQVNRFQHVLRSRNQNGGWGVSGGSPVSIPPQSEYIYYFPDQVTREQYDSMIQGRRTLLLNGICEYCDSFGEYSCRQFELFWQGAPINTFSEISETDCTMFYGYPPQTTLGETYLLPCEQPDEREERENEERKELLKRAANPPPAKPN